jgi:hypothetical protein
LPQRERNNFNLEIFRSANRKQLEEALKNSLEVTKQMKLKNKNENFLLKNFYKTGYPVISAFSGLWL